MGDAVPSFQTSRGACNPFISKASTPLERIIMKRVRAEALNVSSRHFFIPLKAPVTSELFPGVVWTSYYTRMIMVNLGMGSKSDLSTTMFD